MPASAKSKRVHMQTCTSASVLKERRYVSAKRWCKPTGPYVVTTQRTSDQTQRRENLISHISYNAEGCLEDGLHERDFR